MCVCVCVCVCMCVYMHIHVCVYVWMCMCVHVCLHVSVHARTCTHTIQCTHHAKHTQTNAMQTYHFFLGSSATHVAGERAHVADEGFQQVAGQVGHTRHGEHHHHVLERHRHPQVLIVMQVQAAIHRKTTLSGLPMASAFYRLLDKLVATWLVPREHAAISVHVLCAPYNHTPVSSVISLEATFVRCMCV